MAALELVNKIELLTPEQEVLLPLFREHWLKIGTCTEKADRPRAEKAICEMYGEIQRPSPAFLWTDSPATALLTIYLLQAGGQQTDYQKKIKQSLEQRLKQQLRQDLWQDLGQNLGQNLWQNLENLWQNLGQDLGQRLRQRLRQNLWQNLRQSLDQRLDQRPGQHLVQHLGQLLEQSLRQLLDQGLDQYLDERLGQLLRQNLWQNLGQNLENLWQNLRQSLDQRLIQDLDQHLRKNLQQRMEECFWGQHEASWIAFYLYGEKIGASYEKKSSRYLHLWAEIAQSCGWWFPYENLVVACERPLEYHMNTAVNPVLHKDGGPALIFRDGWSLWALNGVQVSQQIAETPKDQIPVEWWLKEKNVEIRGQIERKIGTARILRELEFSQIHAEIVTINGRDLPYSVMEVTLKNGGRRRLIEMENPSTKEVHREWIPPDINTVRKALAWRNGINELPEVIT